MLSAKSQRNLLKALQKAQGWTDAQIDQFLGTGESDIEIDTSKTHILNDTDMETLKTNIKKGHEEAYPEILGKQLNKDYDLGLSTADAKDTKKIIEALQAKAVKAAGINESDKVKELNKSILELQKLVGEKDTEITNFKTAESERQVYNTYFKQLPENRNKFRTDDEHITALKKVIGIDKDGNAIDVATGQTFKDNLQNPVKFDAKVKEFYEKNEGSIWLHPNIQQQPANRGTFGTGSNGLNGGGGSLDAIQKAIYDKYSTMDLSKQSVRDARAREMQAAIVEANRQ